jgi:hypothetical protein
MSERRVLLFGEADTDHALARFQNCHVELGCRPEMMGSACHWQGHGEGQLKETTISWSSLSQ